MAPPRAIRQLRRNVSHDVPLQYRNRLIEVNTEEEWQQLLTRVGLILVDVYSDWSGPCAAMVNTLKKIKLEIAGDMVDYAIARNDDISDLARFRGRSEPVWMFLQNGKMVNLMFGVHCSRLQKSVMDEIKRTLQFEMPKWQLNVGQRAPEEEARWREQEAIRQALEEKERIREEAEKREKYERFMAQMVLELCEETALILYPCVFKDDKGNPKDKIQCPAYMELVQDLFKQCFDVLEEARIQLNEETICKMFVESNVDITENLIKGLTDGKCMAMRLRGKPPHPDWPVHYPYESPDPSVKGPIRTIDDIENYLISIITTTPLPLVPSGIGPPIVRPIQDLPYIQRHVCKHEPDPEIEGDVRREYPAVWVPPQARSKVHVFKTLFPAYMEKAHTYEEPIPLPSLCAFKFNAPKFAIVRDTYELHRGAIEHFGAFEYDQPPHARRLASSPNVFEEKVKYKTGDEIFVLILRRINEEVFLAFAGIEPFFVTENDEEAKTMVVEYFPEGAQDAILFTLNEEEEFKVEEEADYEEEEEERYI